MLAILAIVDLTVGVANDAVNFINSAIGSKAAKFRTIIIMAALGVLLGVLMSGGMMEVARKGIFDPSMFNMPELLIIFLSVMYQDVLLLDLFNTFGLPTSTTVSIVFGLLGSSMGVAMLKIIEDGGNFAMLEQYIHSGKVLSIISAILLSIVMAFILGSIIQYLSRMLFTFNYKETFKKYGPYWSAMALTALTMFILLKGVKGAEFMKGDIGAWIKDNMDLVILYSFIGWSIILQLLSWFTKVNILRVIVLVGTFALALAFAANDLVNFIGAPLAGFNAYQIAQASGGDPMTASMAAMTEKVAAPIWMLLFSGMVMVLALIFNKKARTVAMTTIKLGSQNDRYERFESNAIARAVVRIAIVVIDFISSITPAPLKKFVQKRFDLANYRPVPDEAGDLEAFDLIRAAVITMVSAALISIATIYKLPLSTTYVTFIVAMAAALPDKAWGRESAVYRVSGVINVIGGWFFTAFSATLVAFTISVIIFSTGLFGVFGFAGLVAFALYRTRLAHKNKEADAEEKIKKAMEKDSIMHQMEDIYVDISKMMFGLSDTYKQSVVATFTYDLKGLKDAKKDANKLVKDANALLADILRTVKHIPDIELDNGYDYANSLSAFNSVTSKLRRLTVQNFNYFDNNHASLEDVHIAELKKANDRFQKFVSLCVKFIRNIDNISYNDITSEAEAFIEELNQYSKNQLHRVKSNSANMRRSILFMNMVSDTEDIVSYLVRVTSVANKLVAKVEKKNKHKDK